MEKQAQLDKAKADSEAGNHVHHFSLRIAR
jgi:hypothetical protein